MRKLICCLLVALVHGLTEHFDEKVTLAPMNQNEIQVDFRFYSNREFDVKSGKFFALRKTKNQLILILQNPTTT